MKLGPYELNSIITGDARELAEAIPDCSVDLIFTDPVYDRIEDYEWLAKTAVRVLKDDRACLVAFSIKDLDNATAAMRGCGLSYRWELVWYQSNSMRIYSPIFNKWTPLRWYEKGRSKSHSLIQDLRNVPLSTGNGRQDNHHAWAKRTELVAYYLEAFTKPGDIVFDPFTGGGTTHVVCKMLSRNYLAFEICEETAEKARERVRLTQPPLLIPGPQQLEIGL